MPPKKTKDGPAKLADKENLARAETEILSLQQLLELRTHETLEARRSERLWRERVEAFSQTLQQQREDTLDITSDMVRQYKTMQDQLMARATELENERSTIKSLADEKDAQIKALKAEVAAVKKASEVEILEYRNKMEEMQNEFSTMLRDTIEKMSLRVQSGQLHAAK